MSIIHYQMEIKMIYNERNTEHLIVFGCFSNPSGIPSYNY